MEGATRYRRYAWRRYPRCGPNKKEPRDVLVWKAVLSADTREDCLLWRTPQIPGTGYQIARDMMEAARTLLSVQRETNASTPATNGMNTEEWPTHHGGKFAEHPFIWMPIVQYKEKYSKIKPCEHPQCIRRRDGEFYDMHDSKEAFDMCLVSTNYCNSCFYKEKDRTKIAQGLHCYNKIGHKPKTLLWAQQCKPWIQQYLHSVGQSPGQSTKKKAQPGAMIKKKRPKKRINSYVSMANCISLHPVTTKPTKPPTPQPIPPPPNDLPDYTPAPEPNDLPDYTPAPEPIDLPDYTPAPESPYL